MTVGEPRSPGWVLVYAGNTAWQSGRAVLIFAPADGSQVGRKVRAQHLLLRVFGIHD
jgi:hypothetical protein